MFPIKGLKMSHFALCRAGAVWAVLLSCCHLANGMTVVENYIDDGEFEGTRNGQSIEDANFDIRCPSPTCECWAVDVNDDDVIARCRTLPLEPDVLDDSDDSSSSSSSRQT
jgi:hypothetical protein